MFRNINRAMVISRTKSTATKVVGSLFKQVLKGIGHSRSDIVRTAVETMSKELDQADLKKAQTAFFGKPIRTLFPDFITNTSLSSVVILASKGPRLGSRFFEVKMIDPRKAAQEQAEASFDGFITDSKYGLYGLIEFLLLVRACNFSVKNDSFPPYNGEQYSRYNLN